MTAPNFSTDPQADLIRRIIEARGAYERLCGAPPTCIHVNGAILNALTDKGFKEGDEVAGMKIVMSPQCIGDIAICSRYESLFHFPPVSKPSRRKVKKP